MAASTGLSLTVGHPSPNQEFSVGVDFLVSGTAVGTGGVEPHPIDFVTVRVDMEPPVNANLTASPPSSLAVAYSATVHLNGPGEHQVAVTATDDIGRSIMKAVAVATPGTTHCQANLSWNNYPQTQSLIPNSTCTPESLADIAAIVREAEAVHKRVHAFGSKWSFSDCAFTSDYVIDTTHLNRALQTVQRALRPGQSSLLYHVEAGITIRSLYYDLSRLGLALETMGGASGQTLAGAISTGTHGGDKSLAPLADSVLALHLVGAGGTQFWIEPSLGITDPEALKAHVVPDVDRQNIIYDDATFDACLVSLGCMGVIYGVVLRVRQPYDLVETTVETTWRAFKASASTYLNDPGKRFLQVAVNPYTDSNNDNLCLVTTRSEADDTGLPAQQRLAKIVQGVLTYTPDQRHVMVAHYGNIMRTLWPTETFQGSSYSVMDIGYGQIAPSSQPGYSIELFLQAIDANGKLGSANFVDAVIGVVNAATNTFFTGYVSLRFTGSTRAYLGMQQWSQTCAVEISLLQRVQGLDSLITRLYKVGVDWGGLSHWGQLLDLSVQGHASLYRQYSRWREIYTNGDSRK